MSRVAAMLAGLAALLPIAQATAKDKPAEPQHVFGPAPDWAAYKQIAEADVAARMVDPESARFHWSGGFYPGTFKPFLESKVTGYVACGLVNAKNRMGGYTGYSAFVVVIDYGRVLYAGIDRSSNVGSIGEGCIKAREQGLLPPVPGGGADEISPGPSVVNRPAAAAPSDSTITTGTGLTLRAMPEGAYVTSVAPGSAGAAAGLKPGMVIASVNGIALARMGEAAGKVVDGAGSRASLTLVGGTTLKMGGGL